MQHLDIQRGAVTRVFMNRPEVHNAFDDLLIGELTETFRSLATDDGVRVVVLGGHGKSFSAGADLNWMKSMVSYGEEENLRDSRDAAAMFEAIDRCPKPVVAHVHGAALGGGTGLVAACDIAIGVPDAKFGFTEVKLGILPAIISPYVVRKIGPANARELFLTGERIDGTRAAAIGLLNHVVSPGDLFSFVQGKVAMMMSSGPEAMAAVKELIRDVAFRPPAEVVDATVRAIARARVSKEGQEGMNAFLGKRKPEWVR